MTDDTTENTTEECQSKGKKTIRLVKNIKYKQFFFKKVTLIYIPLGVFYY